MLRGAFAALALLVSSSAWAELGREDQWRYVAATADHGARAELRGDHPAGVPSLLILEIECNRQARTISVRHTYDPREFSGPYPASEPFQLDIDDRRTLVMTHQPPDDATVRRLPLSPEIAGSVAEGRDFQLYTPSESGDPWLLGSAWAFKRLVRECWERSVR